MQNSDYSILELNEKNILSFSPYLPEELLEGIRLENVGAMGLVKDGTTSCGALIYSVHPENGVCFLDSLCVDESQREQGLGRMLYGALEEKMAAMGQKEIRTRVVIPEEETAESFFLAVGFNRSDALELYYDIPLKELVKRLEWMKSRMQDQKESRVIPVSRLSENDLQDMPKFPFDPELSFVIKAGKETGFILVSCEKPAGITIPGMTLTEGTAANYRLFHAVVSKLYTAFDMNEVIHITVTEGQETEFLDLLLSEEGESDTSTGLVMAKTIGEDIPESFTVPASAHLVPRLNGILAMLEDFGEEYEAEILAGEDLAVLNLLRPEGKRPVSLYYEAEDPVRAEGYTLHLISELYLPLLSDEDQKKAAQWMEESSLVSFSQDEAGHVYISVVLPEADDMTDPAVLKEVLDDFLLELDTLSSLDRIASEKGGPENV